MGWECREREEGVKTAEVVQCATGEDDGMRADEGCDTDEGSEDGWCPLSS